VIINPQTKMKQFDLTNATLSFEYLFNGTPFKTVNVPITSVNGNPNTGAVTSFMFSGTQWDPQRPAQNNGISGEVNVMNKTGSIKSGYNSGGPAPTTITQYTFDTQDKKSAQPKQDPKSGQPLQISSSIPAGQSISFDAPTGLLSIAGDKIVGAAIPSDPLLGSNMNFSDYQFEGFTSDGTLAIFWPTSGDGLITVTNGANTFEQGDLPVLFYDVADNLFYGSPLDYTLAGMPTSSPFYDPSPASISSSYLNGLEDVLDPSSPDFDPSAYLFLTINPDTNLDAATGGFSTSASSGAADAQFVADQIPEPRSLIIIVGFASMWPVFGRRRLRARRRS
jgi:hypothetical protein